jgi:3-oxoacyl-[acyl-carrier protein] reductase
MDLELNDKVALVTGASAGIGREVARVLAAEGAQTVIVARRANLLASLADEIETSGAPRPFAISIDLYDRSSPAKIREQVFKQFGHADILINNAGGSRPMGIDAPDEAWDESFALNFTAVRKMTQAFLPVMQSRKWGRIINITGSLEPRGVNAANAAKAGVHAWAKGLSREIAKDGITVHCLGPGRIHSEQIDTRVNPTPENQAAFAKENIPAGYFGDPSDMAYLVAFLCSPKARYLTGQRMYVDGGMHRAL